MNWIIGCCLLYAFGIVFYDILLPTWWKWQDWFRYDRKG